jgi:hypothetical protein
MCSWKNFTQKPGLSSTKTPIHCLSGVVNECLSLQKKTKTKTVAATFFGRIQFLFWSRVGQKAINKTL